MLYLAEVKKQTRRFMGGLTTELQLLACQRNDQTWSAVLGEEIVAYEQLDVLGEGVLLLVKVENRQVQGKPKLANPKLVRLLQDLSRLMGKSQEQEEEIEKWKQSLTYQTQELNQREEEMESRLEELQRLEQELTQLQQQRSEIDKAWANLAEEEQQRPGQIAEEPENPFSLAPEAPPALPERLQILWEAVNCQQQNLDERWQQLERDTIEAQQREIEVEQQGEQLNSHKQELQSTQISLEQAKIQLQVQQQLLQNKEELLQRLDFQRQTYEELRQTLLRLINESADVGLQVNLDITAIENMPLEELNQVVQNLKAELEKLVRFVSDEEEELALQSQTIEELEEKMKTAKEYDRLRLENELAEEQERQNMLYETLVGQRRSLRERDEIWRQHWRILQRRQGKVVLPEDEMRPKINLEPILLQLEDQQEHLAQESSQLTREIEQMRRNLSQLQEMVEQQDLQIQSRSLEGELEQENWQQASLEVAQLQGKVNASQAILQPLQESLQQIRQNLEAMGMGNN